MKNGKNRLKRYTVWYDPYCEMQYIVIRKYLGYVYIKFINSQEILRIRLIECRHDEYVRDLSSLEIELL